MCLGRMSACSKKTDASPKAASTSRPAASPANRLHEDRVPYLLRRIVGTIRVRHQLRRPRDRDTRQLRRPPGFKLVSGQGEDRARRTHEGQAGLLARPREFGALGEKTVARVDSVGPDLEGRLHQGLDVQVGPHRVSGLPDLISLVGLLAVQGVPVVRRVDRDGADAELSGCPEGSYSYLPAVCDQYLL